MAFLVQKINPLDLQPRKAIGVKLPFSGDAVFNLTYQSRDAIKANLINFFLTGRGERLYKPFFGTGLRNLLFENITQDVLDSIEEEIRVSLEFYFPRVTPTNLQIVPDVDSNKINFYLRYSISDTNIEDELIINIQQ
jgi:phage baseplate assembly protein W